MCTATAVVDVADGTNGTPVSESEPFVMRLDSFEEFDGRYVLDRCCGPDSRLVTVVDAEFDDV